MSNVAKGFPVGGTVYVWFKESFSMEMLPQTRIVADVRVLDSSNDAEITFTTGEKIMDGASLAQRVFTTQALCAAAIMTGAILRYSDVAILDETLSDVSTAGQFTQGLCRSSN